MKLPIYGALALFAVLSAGSAQARDCGCPDHKITHHAVVRHAPAHIVVFHHDADAEYAQSYYDYHSSSTVSEATEQSWEVAPDDAHIRFHHRRRPQVAYDADESNAYEASAYGLNGGVGDYQGAVGYYGGYGNQGFVDGYGEMHFDLNGPSYNRYDESFQGGQPMQGRFDFGRGGGGVGARGHGGYGR